MNEAEFTKMTVQETKWSEAAVSEAIESTAKAMGYDTLKLHYTSELIEDYVNNYIPKLQKLYSVFTRPSFPVRKWAGLQDYLM